MSERFFENIKEDAGRKLAQFRNGTDLELAEIKADLEELKEQRKDDVEAFIYNNRKQILMQVGIAVGAAMLVHCIMHHHHAAKKKHHLF